MKKLNKLYNKAKHIEKQRDKFRSKYIHYIILHKDALAEIDTLLKQDETLRLTVQDYLYQNGVGLTVDEQERLEMESEWTPTDYDAAEEAEIDLTQLGIELKAAKAAEISSSNPPLAVEEGLVK